MRDAGGCCPRGGGARRQMLLSSVSQVDTGPRAVIPATGITGGVGRHDR